MTTMKDHATTIIGAPCCAYCYALPSTKLKTCGKCHERKYCSKECQILDWKKGGHKHFCGICGQEGIDWEIRYCGEDSGHGVFALKDLPKNKKIMAERPVLGPSPCLLQEMSYRYSLSTEAKTMTSEECRNYSTRQAIEKLYSHRPDSLDQKMKLNCFEDGGGSSCYVKMSRVNHACLPNATNRYSENRRVRILVASREIKAGEEITISYVIGKPREDTKVDVARKYGFDCKCIACTNRRVDKDLDEMFTLETTPAMDSIQGNTELAIQKCKACLELYDKYQISSWFYHWVYFFMFQFAIQKQTTLRSSTMYIRKAYEAALAYTSDKNDATVLEMKQYMRNPASHPFYNPAHRRRRN